MSRCYKNDERCPHCGITYKRFTTGFKYHEVYLMYWSPDRDSSTWKYKRRNTVLGKWHEIKKDMWNRHIDEECPEIPVDEEEVPF